MYESTMPFRIASERQQRPIRMTPHVSLHTHSLTENPPMSFRTLALTATLLAAMATAPVLAQVKIGVVTSATGPTAMVGIPQKNTVPLLPKKIGDLTVEYVSLDDTSDPTQSVTIIKKLLSEEKVDAIIGPTGSPNA